MVRLAFVFIRPVPWIYTDHAREITRAKMIDQDRFAVGNDKRTTVAAEVAKGFGDGISLDLFLADGEPSGNVHFAFRAPDRATVDRIYEIGRERGHALDRAPALAPHIHANYYAGYLRDPDGRLIEFVCHAPEG